MRNFRWLGLLGGLLVLALQAGEVPALTPAEHGDFKHYTFALTWQPGFCQTDQGCLADQPTDVLVGLHGLWASRPQALIEQGVAPPQWWQKGCDFFRHSDAPPVLGADTQRQLDALMPHLKDSLLVHEYDKHVQCFGFDAEHFFRTELALRQQVLANPFGGYLLGLAGQTADRQALVDAFMRDFGTDQARALQLRCGKGADGGSVLTQLWITIRSDRLQAFPQGDALMDAPQQQDNCPAQFLLPRWHA